jgi:hypothetical protein
LNVVVGGRVVVVGGRVVVVVVVVVVGGRVVVVVAGREVRAIPEALPGWVGASLVQADRRQDRRRAGATSRSRGTTLRDVLVTRRVRAAGYGGSGSGTAGDGIDGRVRGGSKGEGARLGWHLLPSLSPVERPGRR